MRKIPCLMASAILCLTPLTAWGQGYQIQPMLTTIAPSGPQSRMTLMIKNTGEVPITLELSPFAASVDQQGNPTRTPDDKDFLVYPAQTIIPSGKEQSVQVRYIGDATLSEARMYGVLVAQLPVDFLQGETGSADGSSADVKVSFNFLAHIIVSPPSAKAMVAIEAGSKNADGSLPLKLRNDGAGIAVLNSARWTLQDSQGKSVELSTEDVQIGDFSALLPHQDRDATIKAEYLTGLNGPITPKIDIP